MRKKALLPLLSTLALFLSVVTGVFLVQQQQELRTKAAVATWYVSKNGSNSDGRSWSSAWNELDRINWSAVQSGDTILIDGGGTACAYPTTVTGSSATPRSSSGGACGMVYQSTLTVGISGVAIRLASESGRNGTAIIFGGRTTPLGYCGQSNYNWQTSGVRSKGVIFQGQSGVTLDGTKWSGIIVYGHNLVGIAMEGSRNGVVRNVEVYDNGKWIGDSPDQPGIWPSGTNNVFERILVHDNGQDAFQSGGNVNNLTLRQSWLYNSRRAPDGSFWNECRHSDGIQIYAGGEQSGVTIEDSIIGPGFLQGVLLGDSKAVIHDVTVRNSLWYGSGNANIMVDDRYPVNARNLRIENVTSDRLTGQRWHNTFFQGAPGDITIASSVFYGGNLMSVPGGGSYSNNCQYEVGGTNVGTVVNPKYANPSVHGSDSFDVDFTLASDSPCAGRGSTITSIAQLLGSPPAPPPPTTPTPTPIPSPTTTPTKVPTNIPTPTPIPKVSLTPFPGLSWEAESGSITSPFTVTGGYVSQSVETTDPASGGKASYIFNISDAGDYIVKATVNAASLGSDSFFINIDGEPVSPDMIWDIDVTSGFEERTVSWRGSGTPGANEFVPKVFTLTAGEHELIIRGRERDTLIDKITIEKITTTSCTLTGDVNCDTIVNILDFQNLNNNFGTADPASDLNGDGIVNVLDFQIVSNNFGKTNN